MKRYVGVILVIILFLYVGKLFQVEMGDEISLFQRQQMASIGRNLNAISNPSLLKVMVLFFTYGAVHSLQPGHGKSMVSGALLYQNKKMSKIVFYSFIIAFFQTLSALIVVKTFIILGSQLLPRDALKGERSLQILSAGLILIIGLYVLLKAIVEKKHTPSSKATLISILILSVVPCFGTINLLLFLEALKLSKYLIVGALSISLGMFITIAIVSSMGASIKFLNGKNKNLEFLKFLEVLGPLIMISYSVNLLFYNLL